MKTLAPQWKFPPQIAGYMAQEPVQREFFTTENMGGLTRALVRESVQNALDARTKTPVRIRFALIELMPEEYRGYFEELLPHLKVIDPRYVSCPDMDAPMQFLVVEDFNTTGLEGNPEITFQKDPKPGENFYYFWHNVGRTGKSGSNRGSWGLGKTVFPAISEISTFFGLTCRNNDKRRMLMGQSVLRYHEVEPGKPITPYGYFGTFQDKENYFSSPIENQEEIDRFSTTFRLSRKSDEPGLSIVIPAPRSKIKVHELLLQVLQEYFYPILIGDLVVHIDDLRRGRQINLRTQHDNLLKTINQIPDEVFIASTEFNKEAFLRLLNFMIWSLSYAETDKIAILPPNANVPDWSKYNLEAAIAAAQQRFETDQRVAFRVEVPVKTDGRRGNADTGWFYVYLERDESLRGPESYFLRSGIWVKEVKGHNLRGLRGVVVIDGSDNPLVRLLASAENPAHTEWQEQSNALKAYTGGSNTLRFVRQSLSRLGGILTQRDKEVDQNLLRDLFFVERPLEESTRRAKIAGSKAQPTSGERMEAFPELESREAVITMHPIKDGVEIKGSEAAKPNTVVKAEFAYAIRRGNAFQKYEPLDFDLKDMSVKARGVEIELQSENKLHFIVRQSPFIVHVRGFDTLRDVEMRLRTANTES
jgi:hypothetical protein